MKTKTLSYLGFILSLVVMFFNACSNSSESKTISKTITIKGFNANVIYKVSRSWEAMTMKIGTLESGTGKPEKLVIKSKPGFAFVDVDLTVQVQSNNEYDLSQLLSAELALVDSDGRKYDASSTSRNYKDPVLNVGSMFEIPDSIVLVKLRLDSLEFDIDLSLAKIFY